MQTFSRYFPTNPVASGWGWRILDAGRQEIEPGGRYPGEGHPLDYLFESGGRRVLSEFQVVYIASGSGHFESASVPLREVGAGNALLIFPGEWHGYGPDFESGWRESWVGFDGADARRVMHHFFSPRDAVLQTAWPAELEDLWDRILHWTVQKIDGGEQIAASHIPLILSFLKAGSANSEVPESGDATIVRRAKAAMLLHWDERTNLQELALELGCSYSRFRLAFKQQTGHAPREFENQIKLNRSRDLLLHQRFRVSEVAEMLGYRSVYYFSRAFKRAFGQSPQKWLQANSR